MFFFFAKVRHYKDFIVKVIRKNGGAGETSFPDLSSKPQLVPQPKQESSLGAGNAPVPSPWSRPGAGGSSPWWGGFLPGWGQSAAQQQQLRLPPSVQPGRHPSVKTKFILSPWQLREILRRRRKHTGILWKTLSGLTALPSLG